MNIREQRDLIYINEKFAYDPYQSPLGKGQFGTVYKGFEVSTNSPVAIKVAFKDSDPDINDLYEREMMILSKIKGENFVRGLGSAQSKTCFYMVMEFCEGGSLEKKLESKNKLPERECLNIAYQIANAFASLETEGIKDKYGQKLVLIHRDIKPANILFSGDKVKVADFGLGKLVSEINRNKKLNHTYSGTPLYMSPQLLEQKEFSAKCDVFSTGVMLYEMLHGTSPREFLKAATIESYLFKLPTLTYSSGLQRETIALLKGMLERWEEKRFDWAQVLAHPAFSKILPNKENQTAETDREKDYQAYMKYDASPAYIKYDVSPRYNIFRTKKADPVPKIPIRNHEKTAEVTLLKERKSPHAKDQPEIRKAALKNCDARSKSPNKGYDKQKIDAQVFRFDQPAPKNKHLKRDIFDRYLMPEENNQQIKSPFFIKEQEIEVYPGMKKKGKSKSPNMKDIRGLNFNAGNKTPKKRQVTGSPLGRVLGMVPSAGLLIGTHMKKVDNVQGEGKKKPKKFIPKIIEDNGVKEAFLSKTATTFDLPQGNENQPRNHKNGIEILYITKNHAKFENDKGTVKIFES